MPSTSEGLSAPDPGEDVNTAQGFEAAMAARGIERDEGEEEATNTSVEAGITTAEEPRTNSAGMPIDEKGRFVPREPEPQAEVEPEGDRPEWLDPKYSSVEEQAKAYAEAQRLIGARDERADKLELQLAEVQGRLNQLGQTPAAPAPSYSQDQIEELAMQMVERDGYENAATQAANASLETGDTRLYDNVIDAWAMESMSQAQRHIANFEAWKVKEEIAANSQPDPTLTNLKTAQGLEATIEQLASERGAEQMKTLATHMDAVYEQMEPELAAMVASDNARTRLLGVGIMADRATLLAARNGASNTDPTPSSAQRKLAGASVATGALSPPGASPTGTPQTVEEAITAFKKELMETDTTSVADGLTYGPAR